MFFRSRRTNQPFFSRLQSTNRLALIARGVLAVWMTPILMAFAATIMLCVASSPAQAQAAPRTVIVLDFSVEEGVDPLLGRKAADAFAVELANSREYIVIPRERVLQTVENTAGLTPPFDEATQARLGRQLNASSIFSGRVVNAAVNDRNAARATTEVRQLDVASEDYINGAVVSEVSGEQLQPVDNDILIDQAINKGASVAVRTLKQSQPLIGTVLNITQDIVVINLGARNGVGAGQRFSVLRDIHDPTRAVTERLKVGVVEVSGVDADQSTARQVEGRVGVRTGDKVRRIFDPRTIPYPVSGNTSSAPGGRGRTSSVGGSQRRGTPGVVKRGGDLLLGLGALVGLVALAGFGGGAGGSRADDSPPTGVRAVPTTNTNGTPSINVNYEAGIPGVLAGEQVIGYLIYRSQSPNFSADFTTLQEFITGDQRTFADNEEFFTERAVSVFVNVSDNPNASPEDVYDIDQIAFAPGQNPATVGGLPGLPDEDGASYRFTKEPPVPGIQYFYKVQRLSLARNEITDDNNITVEYSVRTSEPSASSGGATAIPRPTIVSNSNNLDDFSVTIQSTIPVPVQTFFTLPQFVLVQGYAAVDQFVVEVSVDPNFSAGNTFTQVVPNPGTTGDTITLSLGNIRVPNFEVGEPLFVRVGARNSRDVPGNTVFGNPLTLNAVVGDGQKLGSRFLPPTGDLRRAGGVGLPGSPAGSLTRSGSRRTPGRVGR